MAELQTSSHTPRHSRACRSCSSSKAKCVKGTETGCERCTRMSLECIPQPPRKRREVKEPRVGLLERRLDDLVCLLSQAQNTQLSISTSQQYTSANAPLMNDGAPIQNVLRQQTTARRVLPTPPLSQGASPVVVPPRASRYEPLLDLHLQEEEQQSRLDTFRREMTQYFPFIEISTSISPPTLYSEKPFLFTAIMLAASTRKIPYLQKYGRRLLEYLSLRVVVNGEKSLDLLQGTLVYISWCNYQHRSNAQISYLIQLAIAMVGELGLNRPQQVLSAKETYISQATKARFCITEPASTRPPEASETEMMRSYLGCYYLSSIISSYSQKIHAMPFTDYTEKCCSTLLGNHEISTDVLLGQLVRLESVSLRICNSLYSPDMAQPFTLNTPVMLLIHSLEKELQAKKQSFPLKLQDNHYLTLQYHFTEISLYSIVVKELTTSPHEPHNQSRITLLSSLLTSLQSYFNTLFQILPSTYLHLPFPAWTSLATSLLALSKLVLFEHPGWDADYARTLISMPSLFEQMSQNFQAAGMQNGGTEEDNTFLQFARMMKWAKRNFEDKVGDQVGRIDLGAEDHEPGDQYMCDSGLVVDDGFWQEWMGDWGVHQFSTAFA
ncbi:hypothetical protein B0O99DRAFT_276659 [Bisporella sp. PMI_857]|nr:hypothetical protein B0O99DRAFT_276659 [Bisporella sp. PMI_857]